AVSLEAYLGGFRWFLDNVLVVHDVGGLEAIPGCQRYVVAGNWKNFCDNFSGDHYHGFMTHASMRLQQGAQLTEGPQGTHGYFEVRLDPAHGLGGIYTDTAQYERDRAQAQHM